LFGIFQCAYSPTVILLSSVFLSESLTAIQWAGMICILLAIMTLTLPSTQKRINALSWKGTIAALLTVVCNAVSAVLVKPVLMTNPLIPSVTFRLAFGTLALYLYLRIARPNRPITKIQLKSIGRPLILPTFLGSFLGTILWLAGFKFTYASVASVLNETSSLFIVLLGIILLKEEFTARKIFSLLIAFGGVLLVILN